MTKSARLESRRLDAQHRRIRGLFEAHSYAYAAAGSLEEAMADDAVVAGMRREQIDMAERSLARAKGLADSEGFGDWLERIEEAESDLRKLRR